MKNFKVSLIKTELSVETAMPLRQRQNERTAEDKSSQLQASWIFWACFNRAGVCVVGKQDVVK